MPGLNGIDTLKEIMRHWRLPVIVVSSHSTAGASITLKALALGAFDFVAKPQDVAARMPEIAAELIKKIRAAAQSAGVQAQFLPGRIAIVRTAEQTAADRTHTHHCHRRFDRRSERAAISVFAAAGGVFGQHSGRAAHAGRVHGTVCQATRRELPDPGEGSAIGRPAGGRAGADLSRKPAHEGQETAAGQRGRSGRRRSGERASSVGGRAVPQRGRRNSVRRPWPS